jgi:DNA-directed RNA polymerase subunit M/transcription elongation factor TFIIS
MAAHAEWKWQPHALHTWQPWFNRYKLKNQDEVEHVLLNLVYEFAVLRRLMSVPQLVLWIHAQILNHTNPNQVNFTEHYTTLREWIWQNIDKSHIKFETSLSPQQQKVFDDLDVLVEAVNPLHHLPQLKAVVYCPKCGNTGNIIETTSTERSADESEISYYKCVQSLTDTTPPTICGKMWKLG